MNVGSLTKHSAMPSARPAYGPERRGLETHTVPSWSKVDATMSHSDEKRPWSQWTMRSNASSDSTLDSRRCERGRRRPHEGRQSLQSDVTLAWRQTLPPLMLPPIPPVSPLMSPPGPPVLPFPSASAAIDAEMRCPYPARERDTTVREPCIRRMKCCRTDTEGARESFIAVRSAASTGDGPTSFSSSQSSPLGEEEEEEEDLRPSSRADASDSTVPNASHDVPPGSHGGTPSPGLTDGPPPATLSAAADAASAPPSVDPPAEEASSDPPATRRRSIRSLLDVEMVAWSDAHLAIRPAADRDGAGALPVPQLPSPRLPPPRSDRESRRASCTRRELATALSAPSARWTRHRAPFDRTSPAPPEGDAGAMGPASAASCRLGIAPDDEDGPAPSLPSIEAMSNDSRSDWLNMYPSCVSREKRDTKIEKRETKRERE